MVRIFLDDVRSPDWEYATKNSEWITTRTYHDCIELLKEYNGHIEILSLDHDLNCFEKELQQNMVLGNERLEEKTGYHVACWMEENVIFERFKLPFKTLVHSRNPVGHNRIKGVIDKLYDRYGTQWEAGSVPSIYTNKGILV